MSNSTIPSGSQVSPGGAPGGVSIKASFAPPGVMLPYAGTSVPAGWLLCDGAAHLPSEYPDLFAVIGNQYGWDGTRFNVPDCRDRTVVGVSGSKPANTKGGVESHALTMNEMPWHNHGYAQTPHGHGFSQWPHNHLGADHLHGGVTDHTHSTYDTSVAVLSGTWGGQDPPAPAEWYGVNGLYRFWGTMDQWLGPAGIMLAVKHNMAWGTAAWHGSSGADRGLGTGAADRALWTSESNANIYFVNDNANISFTGEGANGQHTNMQPYIAINYIIKT